MTLPVRTIPVGATGTPRAGTTYAGAAVATILALVLALALALWPTTAGPARAATVDYVALGDSYSSGVGAGAYLADGSACLRSARAYPVLLAAAGGYDLTFRACSGAKVADVRSAQLGAVDSGTDLVTVTAGGNDAGFAPVLTECAQPAWLSDCDGVVDAARSFIRDTLPTRLATLYAEIRAAAPDADLVVVGYPRLFNGEDCNVLTFFSGREMRRLNRTVNLFNRVATQVAADAGASYANPTSLFLGHAVCDDVPWIRNLSWNVVESFHPNRAGQRDGYVPTVSPALTGSRVRVTARVARAAEAAAPRLAAQQRSYASLDASIAPTRVQVPDLHSRRALRVAARLGIDVDDPVSLRRAERRYDGGSVAPRR